MSRGLPSAKKKKKKQFAIENGSFGSIIINDETYHENFSVFLHKWTVKNTMENIIRPE